jgi:hypothetical protein
VAKRKRATEQLAQARARAFDAVLAFGPIPAGVAVFWAIIGTVPNFFDGGDGPNAAAIKTSVTFVCATLAGLLVIGWLYAAAAWVRAARLRESGGDGVPLAEVLDKCAATLVTELERPGRNGWTHDMKTPTGSPMPVTALATAYGLKLNRLLGSPLSVEREERIASAVLTDLRSEGGSLWRAHTQSRASVEVSATILGSIVPLVGFARTRSEMQQVTTGLDLLPDEYGHTPIYGLTSLITGILHFDPENAVLPVLIDQLAEAAVDHHDEVFWPIVSGAPGGEQQPSYAHTARAVTAIARAIKPLRLKDRALRVLDGGLEYLSHFEPGTDADKLEETIQRTHDGQPNLLHVKHFTPALVLRALAESRAHVGRYSDLGHGIMRFYRDGAFWWTQDSQAPIWMMYQACQALQKSALVHSKF